MSKKVIIISPNPESYITTSVCELLLRENIFIQAVIVKKFTFKRFKDEFSRDGTRLLKKIWNKLILKSKIYDESNNENIISFRAQNNITLKNVNELSQNGTSIINVVDINSVFIENILKELKPDLVVFTGGGLIKGNILKNSGAGVVNCHMGVLPMYRGMDVVEWPILNKDWGNIGLTIHFMEKGIDTGDILKIHHIPLKSNDTIKKLRVRFEPIMVTQLTKIVNDFLNNNITLTKQKLEDGKQFFIMNEKLLDLAEQKLKTYVNKK